LPGRIWCGAIIPAGVHMAGKEPPTILTPAGGRRGEGRRGLRAAWIECIKTGTKREHACGMVVETCRDMPETLEELLGRERKGQG